MSDFKVCKVVLVGDSGVGKTCIISRYIFNQFTEKSDSTLGASFSSKTINLPKGQKVQLDIWDTAGQEVFRSVNKFFYKDAVIGILVYDITNSKSFESMKDYWYNELKNEGAADIVIGIAGNKSDKFSEEQVSEETARQFAESINAPFSLTSAQDQNGSGIDELFKAAVGKYIGEDIPVEKRKNTVKLAKEEKPKDPEEKKKKRKSRC